MPQDTLKPVASGSGWAVYQSGGQGNTKARFAALVDHHKTKRIFPQLELAKDYCKKESAEIRKQRAKLEETRRREGDDA